MAGHSGGPSHSSLGVGSAERSLETVLPRGEAAQCAGTEVECLFVYFFNLSLMWVCTGFCVYFIQERAVLAMHAWAEYKDKHRKVSGVSVWLKVDDQHDDGEEEEDDT